MPWETHGVLHVFGGYNPDIGGSKPSFFMGTWGSKVVFKWVISPTYKCDILGL